MTNTTYTVHTTHSAPEVSADALRRLEAAVGRVPNLAASMAESPALVSGFVTLRELFASTSELSGAEVQVLLLTAAYENDCAWCVAFHTAMALREGVGRADVGALRDGRAPDEPKLQALSTFARGLLRNRGAATLAEREAFHAAGYSKRHALDVVAGLALATMANYAGHVTDPPLDDFLGSHAWKR